MRKVINPLAGTSADRWTTDGLTFSEAIVQPYPNCRFSAGTVEGHPTDVMYLRWQKPEAGSDGMLLLTPDEAAALAWCLTGVVWGHLIYLKEGPIPEEA